MIVRVLLLMLACGVLASCSRAERVRVEFEASLIDADSSIIDLSPTVSGHYEFDSVPETVTESLLGPHAYATLDEFVVSDGREQVYSRSEGQVRRGINTPLPFNSSRQSDWSVRVGPSSNIVPQDSSEGVALNALVDHFIQQSTASRPLLFVDTIDSTGQGVPLGPPMRLADDINSGDMEFLLEFDFDGDGSIEVDELLAVVRTSGDTREFLIETPFIWSPEVILSFTPKDSLQTINDSQLSPLSLEELASATLTFVDPLATLPGPDSATPASGQIDYQITSLRVLTIPEPPALLLATGLAALALPPRRCAC